MTLGEVQLWGRTIGAVSLQEGAKTAAFEYVPEFLDSGIELSPLRMPLQRRIYMFPELAQQTFHGLPGLLADSLPDRFGNALIDQWLATLARTPESFNAVERLCYTGTRGMGALEFRPVRGPRATKASKLDVAALVALASDILSHRQGLSASLERPSRQKALQDILRVGTSAGGARAKALVAWNPETNEVRSGQVTADPGFGYWLLKFDGVAGNRDKELLDPQGFGAVEYAYALMAKAAGIGMSECRLLEEGGRRHFMTKRFDRLDDGSKLHMQSLGALAHFDYNLPGAYSYEQAFLVIRQLGLPMSAMEQQFRRMLFNVVARNQDDHVKNIAFLMDMSGRWSLAPAFDASYSYNPTGEWTSAHQMTLNGKRDGFTVEDFRAAASVAGLKRGREKKMLTEVVEAVREWPRFAREASVDEAQVRQIAAVQRLNLS